MQPQQGTPDAFLAAIAQSGNEMSQGWMRLMSGTESLPDWMRDLQRNASSAASAQASYLEKQTRLWSSLLSGTQEAVAKPAPGDRRFAGKAWHDNPYYDYLKQSYLLAARYVEELVDAAPLEPRAKDRLRFASRQWIDAMCPANFAATNPQALEEALQSNGESLTRGLANLLEDAGKGRISQTEESAFEVGRNLAVTRGDVVYENELIQLIQYAATTPKVAARPLVMIPPCINKYYILDLQPDASFVGHAVDAGHTVFMVSWRNVGPELGHLTWDDYLEKGVFSALRVAREISGSDQVNALGFCVGGTLLGAGLAILAAKKQDWVASATFLASMHDFADTGQIGLFVDEASVATRERALGRAGILPGAELAFVFSSVRANDLVWPYVVNNYLRGGRPAAFDLLYWNADSTNLPGPMYCYYLRNMYLENKLRTPGALSNCGTPVDLGKVKVPLFLLATREDHIVPWRSAYRTTQLMAGDKTFVLGASGHVAGVVNPASKNKRSYWVSGFEAHSFPKDAEEWFQEAKEQPGSWWPVWSEWLAEFSGGTRKAPKSPGSVQYKPVESAPGRYVKQRLH
jgi:polyhydroxyalkanoate synthase